MVDVSRENENAFADLDLHLKELSGWEGITGWPDDEKYPAGQQVAYVATIQEFGHGKIPPRPFMRPAIEKNQEKWKQFAKDSAVEILKGTLTGQEAMRDLSELAARDVQQSIEDVKSPPLSSITLWARYYRKKLGRPVTGATIGEIAARLKSGEYAEKPPVIWDKPLIDTETLMKGVIGEAMKA